MKSKPRPIAKLPWAAATTPSRKYLREELSPKCTRCGEREKKWTESSQKGNGQVDAEALKRGEAKRRRRGDEWGRRR
jgi:hypothetical protein